MYICIGNTCMYWKRSHDHICNHYSNPPLLYNYLLTPDSAPWELWSLPTFFLMSSSTLLFNHHCPYSHSFLMMYQDTLWFSRYPVSPLPPPVLHFLHLISPAVACEGYYQVICKYHKLLSLLRRKKTPLLVALHLHKVDWQMIILAARNIIRVSYPKNVGIL